MTRTPGKINPKTNSSKNNEKKQVASGADAGPQQWLFYTSLGLIALVTWVTLGSVLNNGFINYDDNIYIYENPAIRDFTFGGMVSFFSGNLGQYPPLVMMVFSTIHHFSGLDPLPYHAVNLAFHILNSMLVFLFVYRFDKRILAALIAGILFGIHPLHVESVAWATELKDVLYTFFFLLGILAYQRYPVSGERRKYLFPAFFWFLLSCLSKGMAVVFPLVLLLMDYFRTGKITAKHWIEKVPFLALSVLYGIITYMAQQKMGATAGSDAISWFQRVLIAFYGLVFYAWKFIVPTGLTAFYAFPVRNEQLQPLLIYISPLIVALVAFAAWFTGKYRRVITFGLLFYLLNLLLVLQIIPVGMAITADRYFYLSSIGLFMITGFVIDQLIREKPKLKGSLLSATVMLLALLAVSANSQLKTWENSVALWNNVLKDAGSYPGYALAFTNRGDAQADLQDYESAVQDYTTAIRLNPSYVDAYNNRGLIRGISRDYQAAKADFDEAIRLHPDFVKAYNNRGNANRYLGNMQAALDDFTRAVTLKPDYWDAYLNRGMVQYLAGNQQAACADWKKVQSSGSTVADRLLLDYCGK